MGGEGKRRVYLNGALVSMLALPLCVGNNHCCISVRGRGGERDDSRKEREKTDRESELTNQLSTPFDSH